MSDVPTCAIWRWSVGGLSIRKTPLPFPPELAVEVLSPSEVAIDVNSKVLEYLAGGRQEVWVVDAPNREILILRANDALESALLPGFSVRVADVVTLP